MMASPEPVQGIPVDRSDQPGNMGHGESVLGVGMPVDDSSKKPK